MSDRARWWVWDREHSRGWNLRLRFWRVGVQFTLMRHRYPLSPDRWVLQPHFIYDRGKGQGYGHDRAA